MLPISDMPIRAAKLEGLVEFVENFIEAKISRRPNVFGNSLGGHLALLYTLKHQENVRSLILTGSSGLFETSMGGSYPKRGDYEYIKNLTAYTFYNPAFATKKLVDEIFEVTKSIPQCYEMVSLAKSAQRNNLAGELHKVKVPALLIWGLNDTITPPATAHDFNRLLVNSRLRFIDHCCHAPMMEHPETFNKYFSEYLDSPSARQYLAEENRGFYLQ